MPASENTATLSEQDARQIAEDFLSENQIEAGAYLGAEHIPASEFEQISGARLTGGSWLVRFSPAARATLHDSPKVEPLAPDEFVTIVVNDVTGGSKPLVGLLTAERLCRPVKSKNFREP